MLRKGSGVTVPNVAKYVENPESVYWSKVCSVPVDTKTKEFQYKFVNDLLSNRHCLKKWKIVDSATCIYYKAHDENITNIF